MSMLWQTKESRIQLLKDIVAHDSVTGSQGELSFPYFIKEELMKLDYFNQNESHIKMIETSDYKHALMAMYRSYTTDKTVIIMSHYDTVDVIDFGHFESIAFDSDALHKAYNKHVDAFNPYIQKDIESNQYLFGRGVMDMKSGLMMHMSLLERAINESWPINIILLTVPDEEVNSSGMRDAVVYLDQYIKEENLKLILTLNGEPTFSQHPEDDQYYIYSGSIGKIMPSVFIKGKETHVGEPLNGVSPTYLLSQINLNIEYNKIFQDYYKNEVTPLPVSLHHKDLKTHYDVQTPHLAVGYYNIFKFTKSSESLFKLFHETVKKSVQSATKQLSSIYEHTIHFEVITFETLIEQAKERLKEEDYLSIINQNLHLDDREYAIHIIEQLLNEVYPDGYVVVTYLSAPYYPSVNSSKDKLVKHISKYVIKQMDKHYNRSTERINYFNGISDLSYVKYEHGPNDATSYEKNTPGFGSKYTIPFKAMHALDAPVMNIGALGKDAHQNTERIHIDSVSEEVPFILEKVFHKFLFDH
ncbi:M20/M25/M40 family metallo-hydrolase [Macrococcus sp. DPC7161]|uniref:M20/M25/M40 family metallo-hydrolase n=1 Tax=Macrococcus sp. DPC7161 TaxID=2507060 RepID=UPI00100A380B|nr:M20/M25/M40 family metallo-hydrolase [Macrococcus sp. DPC7161]RXK18789.1 M20/M25/M40 family metallo-hydrolase [Macrococcus sp. DPC7161]